MVNNMESHLSQKLCSSIMITTNGPDLLLVELKRSSGEHNTYEVYMIHTNLQVYMRKYTPWNSFDVWLHHSYGIRTI